MWWWDVSFIYFLNYFPVTCPQWRRGMLKSSVFCQVSGIGNWNALGVEGVNKTVASSPMRSSYGSEYQLPHHVPSKSWFVCWHSHQEAEPFNSLLVNKLEYGCCSYFLTASFLIWSLLVLPTAPHGQHISHVIIFLLRHLLRVLFDRGKLGLGWIQLHWNSFIFHGDKSVFQ